MARIEGIDPETAEPQLRAAFEQQRQKWGAPVATHLVYARRPTILRAARGMWGGLDQSGLIDPKLVAMLNRRVAYLNGCEF